jgi:hypothetical protein
MIGIKFTDETETFRHTTEEKAEFLNDWLNEIGVERCVSSFCLFKRYSHMRQHFHCITEKADPLLKIPDFSFCV